MTRKENKPGGKDNLRRQAEQTARREVGSASEQIDALSPKEARRALHELRVHQIELELQNEELRRVQLELDTARARYFDLYDLAPVGYFVLSEQGLILEANLTAAGSLGIARSALLKLPITRVILNEDQDLYYRCHKQIVDTGGSQACELRMVKTDGTAFWVRLAATAAQDADGAPVCRVVISDITDRKLAEDEVRQVNEKLSALVQKLTRRGDQESVLSELRMFLQACLSTKEIAPILAHSMLRLFPNSDGALFLMSSSKTDLEAVARWGESPNEPAENVFSPDACWGLRRGGAHIVDDVESSLACPHLGHLPAAAYACLPLMAKRDVLGLLHIRSRSTAPRAEVLRMLADLRETSSVLSELLSLSISNLRLSETLSIQSIKDPLTGLFNRRYLEETLRREISRAERRQCEIGVVMADIDHFKTFNDLHGHAAGDLVLTELASLLKTRTRGSDIPCRFGGEEFALVFIESSLEHTVVRANELKEEVKQLKLRHEGQEIGSITVSMGVSAYPSKGTKVEELLLSADAALYRAKQAGRDCVISAGT